MNKKSKRIIFICFGLILIVFMGLLFLKVIYKNQETLISGKVVDNPYNFEVSPNYHLNKKEILDNIWEYQKPLLANSMHYNLGTRNNPYILYNIQLWTNNLLEGAFYEKDYETLDELAELYLIAYDYLEERDSYVYFWPIIEGVPCVRNVTAPLQTSSGKARMWVYFNSDIYNDGYESFGPSVQFLYVISRTMNILSQISPDKRTNNMNEFIKKYSSVIVKDHYARWVYEDDNVFQVKGWGCEYYTTTPNYNHHDFIEKKLNREFGNRKNLSYCNVYSDYDMWLLAGVVEILAANKNDPKGVPLNYEQKSKFLSYVEMSLKLVQDRLSESELVDFNGRKVEGLNFDLGSWNDHYSYDYAEYTGEEFPKESDSYANLAYDYNFNKPSLEELSQKSMILLMHFDETKADSLSGGKDVKDSSGNDNSGFEKGGVKFGVEGKVGNALEFDGIDDSITLKDNILDGKNKFTIESWIKPEKKSSSSYSAILADYDSFYFMVGNAYSYTGKLMWRIWNSQGELEPVVLSNKAVIEWGKWQQVALSFDGTYVKLYHNGKLVGKSDAHSGEILQDNSYLTAIGSRGTVDKWFFKGNIDELKIYDYVLSDSEIKNNYEEINPDISKEDTTENNENQIGWDISHARRFIHLFNALYKNKEVIHSNFPDEEVMKKLTNQVLYETFNRDFEKPLFTNFMDGTNGWYRVGYHGEGFAYAPYDLSISLITGGYGFWNKYNSDMKKLMTSLWNYAQKDDISDPYLCSCYMNYERGCCNDKVFDFETSKELLMFLPIFSEPSFSLELISPSNNQKFTLNKKNYLTNKDYTNIDFKWNEVFGAEYYIFSIDGDYGYNEVKVDSNSRTGNYYGTGNFEWRIKACNKLSCSDWSEEREFEISSASESENSESENEEDTSKKTTGVDILNREGIRIYVNPIGKTSFFFEKFYRFWRMF